jgi:hypothetical protein
MLVLSIASSNVSMFLFVDSMIGDKTLLHFFFIIMLFVIGDVGVSLKLTTRIDWLLFGYYLSSSVFVDSLDKLMKLVALIPA